MTTSPAETITAESRTSGLVSSALLARNATLNIVTEGWLGLVLLANIPLLVKFLGQESFGLFSLAWVVVGYLAFLDIGVSTATTKFTSEYLARHEQAQIAELVRTALAANTVMGIVACLLSIAATPILVQHAFKIPVPLQNQAVSVFVAISLALPILLIQGVLRAVLISHQRFDWINLVNGSAITGQWILMTLLAWKGFAVVTIVWVAVFARAAIAGAFLWLVVRQVPSVFSAFSFCWDSLWRLLHFGVWVSVSQVMSPLLVYLDRVLIAAMISLTAVTAYTVPTELFNRLAMLPSCLMATLFPAFSHHGANGLQKGNQERLFNVTARYLLLILFPLFLCLFVEARDLLTAWMGRSFAAEATRILQILALGAFANFLARLPYAGLQGLGRPDLTGKFHLVELPLYVVLCLILIPRWGIEGAAVACATRFWLDAVLLFWAARKYCRLGLEWIRETARTLPIGILLLGCLVASQHILTDVWGRLCVSAFLMGTAYAAIWIFALNGEDKPAILRTLRVLFRQNLPKMTSRCAQI